MQRASLFTISDNCNRRTELSSYERGLIIEASSLSVDAIEIQKLYGVSKSTVRIIVRRASKRNNDESKFRFERPSKVRLRDKRYIIKIARSEPKIDYADFILRAKMQCNRTTVYRIFKQ